MNAYLLSTNSRQGPLSMCVSKGVCRSLYLYIINGKLTNYGLQTSLVAVSLQGYYECLLQWLLLYMQSTYHTPFSLKFHHICKHQCLHMWRYICTFLCKSLGEQVGGDLCMYLCIHQCVHYLLLWNSHPCITNTASRSTSTMAPSIWLHQIPRLVSAYCYAHKDHLQQRHPHWYLSCLFQKTSQVFTYHWHRH